MGANEQRKTSRTPLRLLIFLKHLDTGKVQRALTKNIGGGGVCMVTEGTFKPGTLLELEIKLPDCENPIVCTAAVIWCRPLIEPKKSYDLPTIEIGLRFVTIDPKQEALIVQYAKLNAPL